ncbi:MAG: hypothetical protein J5I35_09520, partial [Methanothrix harundinacea]|nr:hypothetical protein [Methanothrix harundinacea]
QETSNVAAKINLSVEEELALLKDRNRQLENENAILREREDALVRDGVETLNAVTEALRTTKPGKETARFFRDSETRILAPAPEDKPLVINARIKTAAAMIRDSPAPPSATPTEAGSPLRYDTKPLNQKRGEAIAAHVQMRGGAIIKSTEAGTVLETIEGKKLDRKTVHRALDVARGILRASSEVVGGIRRLVIPSHSPGGGYDRTQPGVVCGGGGDRDSSPHPRRWGVPWDGVD